MKLGLIQTKQNQLYDFANPDIRFDKKQVIAYRREMEDQAIDLIREACILGCDLILTSEAVNFCGTPPSVGCDYTEVVPETTDYLFKKVSGLAAEYGKYIILGAYNKRHDKMYNSAFVYNKKGDPIYVYDKIHLAGSEKDRLTSGKEYAIIDTEFGKIGIAICWDMQFPESCRELVLGGAELILCPTWGWEQIYGHARAYENGVYVASAMSVPYGGKITGIRTPSEAVSPLGDILVRGPADRAQVVSCELDIRDCKEFIKMRLSDRHPDTYKRISQEEGRR